MPPKPTEVRTFEVEYYNIDVSLLHQLRLAAANIPAPGQIASKYLVKNYEISNSSYSTNTYALTDSNKEI